MTTFEILDIIADSYIPVLLLFCLTIVVTAFKPNANPTGIHTLGLLTALITLVYFIQFIDLSFNLWARLDLDYSTHTAFAFALVTFIAFAKRTRLIAVVFSFLCYLLLMLYQQYHSLADILLTIAAVTPFMFMTNFLIHHLTHD